MVSIAGEFFVLVRVRGRNVQVLLSDAVAANDWPIARDVADFLNEDIPDPEDAPAWFIPGVPMAKSSRLAET